MNKQGKRNSVGIQQEPNTSDIQDIPIFQEKNPLTGSPTKISGKHKECLQKARNRRSWTPHLSRQKSPLRRCEVIHHKEKPIVDELDACDLEILDILRRAQENDSDYDDSDEEFHYERRSCNIYFD